MFGTTELCGVSLEEEPTIFITSRLLQAADRCKTIQINGKKRHSLTAEAVGQNGKPPRNSFLLMGNTRPIHPLEQSEPMELLVH